MKQETSLKKHFISGPLAGLALLFLTTGCTPSERAPGSTDAPHPDPLTTTTVRMIEAPRMQELPGTVRPAARATLAAKVMGVITGLPVELGQAVKQGDLLVQIAAGEIAARAEQARVADLQAARALERESELLARNAATAETVRNLEERRQMTQAALAEAETMLSYTRIQAPFDGVISRKLADEGDLASPGQPLLEIERGGNLRVEVDIPDQLARRMNRGDKLSVLLDGETRVEAVLAELSSSADPRTRTVAAKLDLPAGSPARSGMFARVFIPAETIRRIEIPASAVTPHGQIERVFVVQDNKAQLRIVRTGARRNGTVDILSGLNEGEQIITTPPPGLTSGQPVTLQP